MHVILIQIRGQIKNIAYYSQGFVIGEVSQGGDTDIELGSWFLDSPVAAFRVGRRETRPDSASPGLSRRANTVTRVSPS